MDALPIANKTLGEPESTQNKALETGASVTQVCASISPTEPANTR